MNRNPNVRRVTETQRQFRERRREESRAERRQKYGRLLWNSQAAGTYIRAKHGELT